jgi:hypothetical protein
LNYLATTTIGSQGHNHTTSVPSSSIKKTTAQASTNKKASTSTHDQFANTLKGSAERRKQKEYTISNVSGDRISAQPPPPPPLSSTATVASAYETSLISCPFCAFNSVNSVEMEEHVNVFHLQLFETATSSQSSDRLPIPYLAEVWNNFLRNFLFGYNYTPLSYNNNNYYYYCRFDAGVPAM